MSDYQVVNKRRKPQQEAKFLEPGNESDEKRGTFHRGNEGFELSGWEKDGTRQEQKEETVCNEEGVMYDCEGKERLSSSRPGAPAPG